MKLKDYKYEIKGKECPHLLHDLLKVISIGLVLPLFVAILVVIVDFFKPVDNFYLAYSILFTPILAFICYHLKK